MRQRTLNARGVALMLVLILIVVASTLGMSYLAGSSLQMTASANLLSASRARYLAESGAMHAAWIIKDDPSVISYSSDDPSGPFYADGGCDSYTFYATDLGDNTYLLTAAATVGGVTQTSQVTVQRGGKYASSLMAMGPKCYWRLGESSGSTAVDQMGHRDGTCRYGITKGVTGAIPADEDTAAAFDLGDDHVDLGEGVTFVCPGITLTLWIWATDFSEDDGRIVSQEDDQLQLRTDKQDNAHILRFKVELSSGKKEVEAEGSPLPTGQWVFVACVSDGSTLRVYQDAVLVATKNESGSVEIDKTDKLLWIGAKAGHLGDKEWNGKIDEVAIFERALSADEIQQLYDNAQTSTVTITSWDP